VFATRIEHKIAIAFLLVFFPFSPGSVGPIPNVLLSEVLVPLAFPPVLMAVVRAGRPLLPQEGRRYAFAAGVLVAVTFVHFVNGPVLASFSGTGSLGSSGLRPFYDLFVYVLLFFMSVWVFEWVPATSESWARILFVLLAGCVALSVLRLVGVGLGVDTPLMTGVFDYGGRTRLESGVPVLRIGGLAEVATLGLACLAAVWTMRQIKPSTAIILLLWLLACVGLSGGRSLAIGVAFAVLAYLVGPARGRRLRVMVGGALVLGVIVFVAVRYGYSTQIVRILTLQGGIEQQDPARAQIFAILWGYFLENPFIGKGIGVAGEGLSDAFVAAQVVAGGHSSYMSMLGNFGLAGALFIATFVLDPVVRALAHTRRTIAEKIHGLPQGLMTLVLVHAVIKAFEYVAGGSGYRDPSMFIIAAVFVVALSLERRSVDEEA